MNLLIRLGVGWHGKGGVLGFEAVLSLDEPASHQALEVALHGESGMVGLLIRVEVGALATSSLRLLRVQLRLVWLGTATSLSHFL